MAVTSLPSPAASAVAARPERFPIRRAELVLIFGFWTLIAALTAANMLLDPRGRGPSVVMSGSSIALAFVVAYIWAALTPPIFALASRFSVERINWAWSVLILLLAGLALAISVDVVVGWLRVEVFDIVPRRRSIEPDPILRVRRLWFMNEFLQYVAVLAAGFARDFFLRYRARREEAIRLQAQTAQLQAQLADARLAALRTQLDPHFLFNTLNAISALVETDPRGVRRMIARLSELLRNSLEGRHDAEIPLDQELGLVTRYLEIMQIRFGDKLEVAMQIEPGVESALVPNLILQPLVENAIKHGVSGIEGIGRIEITARRDGSRLLISVRDNGAGLSAQQATEGVGLRNTRARLAQLYGKEQSADLKPGEGRGVVIELCLPYHTRDE